MSTLTNRAILILTTILLCNFQPIAQTNKRATSYDEKDSRQLKVGDQVPPAFFKNIPGNGTSKLIILDMWSTGCSSCMEAFPKMVLLQDQFKKQLQIVLVNPWESDSQIRKRMVFINEIQLRNDRK